MLAIRIIIIINKKEQTKNNDDNILKSNTAAQAWRAPVVSSKQFPISAKWSQSTAQLVGPSCF